MPIYKGKSEKLIKIDKKWPFWDLKKQVIFLNFEKYENMTCFFEFWWFWPKIDKKFTKNQISSCFIQIFGPKSQKQVINCKKKWKKWSFLGPFFLFKKWNFILAEYEVFLKNWKKQVIFLKKKCQKNAKKTGYIFELSKFEKLSLCKILMFSASWDHLEGYCPESHTKR